MKINSSGFTLSTLDENLQTWVDRLKNVFGNDFVIKKEGVIDNIATSSSLSIMDLENQIAFLIKQLNPNTAEGEWQDKLYSLIGLKRQQATYTIVSRTVEGTPNTEVQIGALTIENASTKDQFVNNDIIQIGENGKGLGSFTAEESGSIDLPVDATINIITPLENVKGVYYSEGNNILIGQEYESNAEFRQRWAITSSLAKANTEDGLYKSLLELVSTKSDLKIFSNRTSETVNGIPPHCQKIVINSAYDDEKIAQVIFNNIVDGNMVGLQGDISVDVKDSQGSYETIKFTRATPRNVFLKIKVSTKENSYLANAQNEIKSNILNFVTTNKFDMGSKIFANMFAMPIYDVKIVEAITELKISTNGSSWVDYIQLGTIEVPSFEAKRIEIYEEE